MSAELAKTNLETDIEKVSKDYRSTIEHINYLKENEKHAETNISGFHNLSIHSLETIPVEDLIYTLEERKSELSGLMVHLQGEISILK